MGKQSEKSTTKRISNYALVELKKIGDGDWKRGLVKSINAHDVLNKNPEIKLMHDVDMLMSDLMLYYGDNHYEHFTNFPSCFRQFLKKGFQNWSMINKRYDKPIDEFKGDKVE